MTPPNAATEIEKAEDDLTWDHLAGDHDRLPPVDGCSRCQNVEDDRADRRSS